MIYRVDQSDSSKTAEQTGICGSSIRRMIKRKNFLQFEWKGKVVSNSKMKKILTLRFQLTYKTTGYMEKEKNLMFQMGICLRPQIRYQQKLWFPMQCLGKIPQNCSFVSENGIKVNEENYCKHLNKQLFPKIKKLVKRDDWIFDQDSASSYRSILAQDFLEKTFKHRFVKWVE